MTELETVQHEIVGAGLNLIGTPYLFGGKPGNPNGRDCSGLVQEAWTAGGVWPFDGEAAAAFIWCECPRIAWEDRQPGDVVAYWTNPDQPHDCHHVVLVVGPGFLVGANSGGPPNIGETHEQYAARMNLANARVKVVAADYWASHRLGVVRSQKMPRSAP